MRKCVAEIEMRGPQVCTRKDTRIMKNRLNCAAFGVALLMAVSAAAQTTVTNNNDGAPSFVPKFSGSSTLVNSAIIEVNGSVGIGTTSPQEKLDVWGTIAAAPISNSPDGTSGWFMEGRTTSDEGAHDANAVGLGISVDSGDANAYSLTLGVNPPWPAEHITERMRITSTGNVGIGTTSPGAKLEVDGNLKLTANSGASITFQDGTVQTTAFNGVTCGGDYADSVDVIGDRTRYEPGDVLVIDPNATGKFLKSTAAYSTSVTGVYSTRPGVLGRRQTTDRSHMKDEVPMAMVGIVPTKVSAENGSIKPGDLLVSSSTLGYAMKGTDRSQMFGAVIGKALGRLDSGAGLIEVAITLQ